MDFERLWWLLPIPVLFFALGWIAARIDISHLLRESRALPLSYFRGLNFLLNEQPDKAIESFIEVVKVDPQTIDLHFALGNLFRRQGEIDRAIRMHQNLVDRGDLATEQRLNALYELAQDYLKAGLLDRAEELFLKLRGTAYEQQALKFLLEIYEQEKDWIKAIQISRLVDPTGQSTQRDIAHFCCELAQSEMSQSRPDAARVHLQEALERAQWDPLTQQLNGVDVKCKFVCLIDSLVLAFLKRCIIEAYPIVLSSSSIEGFEGSKGASGAHLLIVRLKECDIGIALV